MECAHPPVFSWVRQRLLHMTTWQPPAKRWCAVFGSPVLTTSSASTLTHSQCLISPSPGILVTVLVWKQPEISSFRILDSDMNLYICFIYNWERGMQLLPLFSFIEKHFVFSDSARPFFSPSISIDMATRQDARGDVGEEKGRREKVELLQEAIHGLLEENRVKQQQHGEEEGSMVPRDQEEDLLLSSLLSKLNALEKDVDLDDAKLNSFHEDLESRKEVGLGDIAKDLNKIKRQNMITHILLGTLMVMTAVWQFGEVSFLLGVQKKLSDPFKSFGDMWKSTLKRGEQTVNEASPLPPVSIPDVVTDLPVLGIGDGDGDS